MRAHGFVARLVGGSRSHPHAWYWTQPGDYTLDAVLHAHYVIGTPTADDMSTRGSSIAFTATGMRLAVH